MPKLELDRLKRTMTRNDLLHLAVQCAEEDGVDTHNPKAVQAWLKEQLVPFLQAKIGEAAKS